MFLRRLRSAEQTSQEGLSRRLHESEPFAVIDEAKLCPEGAEVDDRIHGLKSLRNVLKLSLHLIQFCLCLSKLWTIFASLSRDLMLFLNFLDLFVVFDEAVEISIVVIHNLHFIGSLVESVNIGPQLLLQSFHISPLVPKAFNRNSVTDRIDDSMISIHFLNGSLMERAPVQIEDDHDQQRYHISKCDDHVCLSISIGKITQGKPGKSHRKGSRFCVCFKPSSPILNHHWENEHDTDEEKSHTQTLQELEIKIYSQTVLLEILIAATSGQRLEFFISFPCPKLSTVGLRLQILERLGEGGKLIAGFYLLVFSGEAGGRGSFIE